MEEGGKVEAGEDMDIEKPLDDDYVDDENLKVAMTDLSEVKPHLTKVTLADLTEFWKKTREFSLERYPMQHYIVEQVCLAIFDMADKLRRIQLTYIDIRDHFENLYCLQLLVQKNHKVMAVYVSNLITKLLNMSAQLAQDLERISNVPMTKWSKVAELFKIKEQVRQPALHEMVPAMSFFIAGRLLGAGGFGAVYKAMFGQIICTVKFVPVNKLPSPKLACVDKVVAGMVNHPFVVKYHCCFATVQAFVTCMEFIRGVDLVKVLREAVRFPDDINRIVIAQLGVATQHLHMKGFAHRDIKPANMLVMPGLKVKLIDFDTVKIFCGKFSPRPLQSYYRRTGAEVMDGEKAGTMPFFSPEVVNRKKYGRSVDWWAIGVTVYNQATGKLPFMGNTPDELNAKILSGKYIWPSDAPVGAPCKKITADLLKMNPNERLCSLNYSEWQNHVFFKGLDWKWLETSKVLVDYKPILACMASPDGNLSPVASPAAIEKRKMLFPQECFDDTDNQQQLYTYASPGFMKCLAMRRQQKIPTDADLFEPPDTTKEDPKAGYKFSEYLQSFNISTEVEIVITRAKKFFGYESAGFSFYENLYAESVFFIVGEIKPKSPAERAGLSIGDMILKINGKRVFGSTFDQIAAMIKAGETISITVHSCNTFRYLKDRNDMATLVPTLQNQTIKIESMKGRGLTTTSAKDFGFEVSVVTTLNDKQEPVLFLVVSHAPSVVAYDPPGVHLCMGDIITAVAGSKVPDDSVELMTAMFYGHYQYTDLTFVPLSPIRLERANLTHRLLAPLSKT